MKLEKDRLKAKVDNLEANLAQIKNDGNEPAGRTAKTNEISRVDLEKSPTKTHLSQMSNRKGSPAKASSVGGMTAAAAAMQKTGSQMKPVQKQSVIRK